ncbi:class I adenylate-forming enzyme family protein [Bordetella petrii]|uniref:class I adenylate-forming enzyme family protein n=1 Tax=Bordetella petrii TaxID=94624 RepID=UPI001E517BC8|nr:AMP-binding protein [Bordetella petrii]MCD0504208.1 AMP-binding protein [Bordetella petrii]
MYPIDFFLRAAARFPDRVALDTPQGAWTYARLRDEAQALAAALQALDPAPQSRVAICAGNTARHVVALLAVLASGKIWVPLNYRSTAPEVARILDATEPGIVLTDGTGEALIPAGHPAHIHLDAGAEGLALDSLLQAHAGQQPVRCEPGTDATQAIKFTGGTTGLPKGVMQPYRAWNAVIVNQIHAWQLTGDDRYVVAAPVTHGTSTYLLPVLAQGGMHLFLEESSPAAITTAFRERGGTLAFMPPTLIYMLMAQPGVSRRDFPQLRNLIYGGAPMPVDKFERVREFFGPVVGATYGQTESPQIVTAITPAEFDDPANLGSVGSATWFSEFAIMDREGKPLPAGQPGEVVVRGDLVMTGYWRLPEKTADTIVDGWLHTGDVGVVDERGYLYIKDRLRDVIITGGFNVYPIDVENALAQHPAVYESSVFGIPDDKWGEAVQAAVQFHSGASATPQELMTFVRDKLGPVHAPKRIHIYDSLPRSSVGKVLKNVVRDSIIKETA